MGVVEETRKVVPDLLAPELRTINANAASLKQAEDQLRVELAASEERLRTELVASEDWLRGDIRQSRAETLLSESRLSKAIDHLRAELIASEAITSAHFEKLRADLPLLVRNAVLEQTWAEKQRIIEDYQNRPIERA